MSSDSYIVTVEHTCYQCSRYFLLFHFVFCVSIVTADCDISDQAEEELSCSGLTELDLGTDEVFIVSSGPSPSRLPVSLHTVRPDYILFA